MIVLNGRPHTVVKNTPLVQLIESLQLQASHVAVEYNHRALLRSEYERICLQPGDHLELVRAVAGG